MSGQLFPGVPVNPRLEFGVPLAEVCEEGKLHPGLRELFLKAYLSGSGYDREEEEGFNGLPRIPYVQKALKAGPKGQGSLADRISLKLKVESGKWIIATQVPPGAPLWVLRHFLGCLPEPLLHGSDWGKIAIACGAALRSGRNRRLGKVLQKISTALEALPMANRSLLVSVVLLIRNLSAEVSTHDSTLVTFHDEAVDALSQYLTAAIISRPYRPGLHTMLEKEDETLLVFLSEHWLEVEELRQHIGISRYHNTCESRYEFVSPDTEVDHTMRRALATGEDIDEEIDVPECLPRTSNQRLPQITTRQPSSISKCALDEARIPKKEVESVDPVATSNIRKIEIPGKRVPEIVQMPKGVYFIPPEMKRIRTSVVDEEATGKITEDYVNSVGVMDAESNEDWIRLDDPKIANSGYILLRKVQVKDKSKKDSKFNVKSLIGRYEREAAVFNGANQSFRYDDLPPNRKVMAKINGTQTFACELSEDSQPMEVEKLLERTNEHRGFPVGVDIPQGSSTRQSPEENIGRSNNIGLSKTRCNRTTSIPFTKSTALLIRNLTINQELVYVPTESNLIDLSIGRVISEVEQMTRQKEDAFVVKTYKDGKALTNPIKDVNGWKNQKTNSNHKDFVTELKNNFKQGRGRPLLAKFTNTGESASKVPRNVGFACEKGTSFGSSTDCNSTQRLFLKCTSRANFSSANSV